jgi:SAM-dependent methyltransferase
MPPQPLPFTGERLTSDYGGQTQIEHLHRYLLAREWCRGKDVLDVASGEGYGAALLAQVARTMVGVEIAPDAVVHACDAYAAANLRFIVGDARRLPNPDATFDVVVSFETIEHFAEHAAFLAEIRRVLRPGGLLIVSTPDRDNYSPAETPPNPYHVHEMTGTEFQSLLQMHFAEVRVLSQRPIFGSVLMPMAADSASPLTFERRGDRHFEGSSGLSRPQYLIAFATDSAAVALPPSVYIDTGRLGVLRPSEVEARLRSVQDALTEERSRAEAAIGAQKAAEAAAHDHRAEMQALQTALAAAERLLAANEVAEHAAAAMRSELDARSRTSEDLLAAAHAAAHDHRVEMQALQTALAAAQGEAKGLLAANEVAEHAVAAMRSELDARSRTSEDLLAAANARAEAANARAEAQAQELAVGRARLESMYASSSWRVTAPMRAIGRLLFRRR